MVSLISGLLLFNESKVVFLGAYSTEGDLIAEPFGEKQAIGDYKLIGDYMAKF